MNGTINSVPFLITRIKTKSKSSLTFMLGGRDVSRQSTKETQSLIEEELGIQPQILTRCIFHDQFQLNGLLEASDVKLKEELSQIVNLEVWQQASQVARQNAKDMSKSIAELDGMIRIRKADFASVKMRFEAAKEKLEEAYTLYRKRQQELDFQLSALPSKVEGLTMQNVDISSLQELLSRASEEMREQENELNRLLREKTEALSEAKNQLLLTEKLEKDLKESVIFQQRLLDKAESKVTYAQQNWENLQSRWGLFNERGGMSACPTCNQPMLNTQSQDHVAFKMTEELTNAQSEWQKSEEEVNEAFESVQKEWEKLNIISLEVDSIRQRITSLEVVWDERIDSLRQSLSYCREVQSERSSAVAAAASRLETVSALRAAEAKASTELNSIKQTAIIAEGQVESLGQELNNLSITIQDLEGERDYAVKEEIVLSQLIDMLGSRGVQSFLLQNAVDALQYASQAYLYELSDGQQKLELSIETGDRITKIAHVKGQDGEWHQRSLSALSGGQWRRASLAVALGFAELIARRGGLQSSLLVLDEPLTHLDAGGRENVGNLLRKLVDSNPSESKGLSFSTILIVLQDLSAEELDSFFDHIDEVHREQGSSSVSLDVGS